MATTVISPHEVVLNSVRFPISGFVQEGAIDRFPEKLLIGLPDYENEQLLSNWVISDFRGGLGIEEMDEAVHKDRYWWSNCETRFRSNLLLGPLATLLKGEGWKSPTSATDSDAAWGTIANAYDEDTTTRAQWGGGSGNNWSPWLELNIASLSCDSVRYYVGRADANVLYMNLDVYYSGGWVSLISGNTAPTWDAWTTVAIGSTQSVTAARIRMYCSTISSGYMYEFDFNIASAINLGTGVHWCEFNSKLYKAHAAELWKLNATGDGFTYVRGFPATITALIQNGTNLFILLGTSAYWYMNTSEAFTEATPTGAVTLCNKGVWWDDKLFQFATDGWCRYSAAPASATPAYTANGKLPIASGELQELLTYFDANGNDIIYCSTKVGLFSHDFTNAKFLHTALKVPSHPTAGKGMVVWHDGLFVSAGLNVTKYIAESTATIEDVGLAKDDGLPQLYSGEVVKFIEGYSEFFALIDSTYEGVESRSQVVSYDGQGWRTWWSATADNKNMYGGIVSSVFAYRLWFSNTDGVYYITLQRHNVNPKKVSGYAYATPGMHITPRFDAGTKAFRKLATKLTLFLDDMSANEVVGVTYQIDQAQGAFADLWTALVSYQTADGVIEKTFGTSGVGILFYDIQFRIRLARGSTTTLSPIIKGMVLSYLKILGRKRSWSFTINTAEAGRVSSTPKALTDAIATILTTNTLMLFTFRDGAGATDTKYCLVQPFSGQVPTGQNWQSLWNLTCIEI